jgi:glutamyl-tRNA reductase
LTDASTAEPISPAVPPDGDPVAAAGLAVFLAHARSVPSAAREAFGDHAATIADPRAILLRTCHRVELYVVDDRERVAPVTIPELPDGGRRLDGSAAVRHLFAVAAGMDSVIVGEDQILHQLRECLSDRRLPSAEACPEEVGSPAPGAPALHPVLERLFQGALHLGRETRSWREGQPRSLADVALDRIGESIGPLVGRRVLVVGAGQMARLTARAAARRGAHVLVANRSAGRAAVLANDVNGEVAAFGAGAGLPDADAMVLAIAARWPLSTAARAALVTGRQPVVDLSSPPALDPDTRLVLGARHTSVDDLAADPQDAGTERARRRIERAIDGAQRDFIGWTRGRAAVPAIRALTERAEARRAEELERLFRRADLSDAERALVVKMSQRLVAGLLHAPLVRLRDDDTGELEQAARALFAL